MEYESLLPGGVRNAFSRRTTKSRWATTIFSRPVLIAIFSAISCYIIIFNFVLSDGWLSAKGHSYFFGPPTESGRNASVSEKGHTTVTQWQTETEIHYETVTATPVLSEQEKEDLAGPPHLAVEGLLEKSLDELKEMIRHTKGYLARDWTLALGWNNMRYIIEAALLDAKLLNRTLVLPSFIYARGCEHNQTVCTLYASRINRYTSLGVNEIKEWPEDKQWGWRIPIEMMIDLPYLRSPPANSTSTRPKHSVILTSEYLLLQGLDHTRESFRGSWDRGYYHSGVDFDMEPEAGVESHGPDLGVVRNDWFDPTGIVRVDRIEGLDEPIGSRRRSLKARQDAPIGDDEWDMGYDDTEGDLGSSEGRVAPEDPPTNEAPPPPSATSTERPSSLTMIGQQYAARLQDELARKSQQVLDWSDARRILQELTSGIVQSQDFDEAGCERLLKAAGWAILHTWEPVLGMEFTKTVVKPIRQVAPVPSLRSLTLDFSFRRYPQRVLLLEGELHLGRKPGSLRFTSVKAREDYARIVLQDLRPPEWVRVLASRLIRRMDYIRNGRAWLAAHMRRGDFTKVGWAMEPALEDHYKRILNRLDRGRALLSILQHQTPQPYDVPDVSINMEIYNREPPLASDSIYLATDERSEEGLQYLRQNGAILFNDLMTQEDRRQFGWGLLFSDVVALVEQQVIGKGSSFFYAHAMSSVAGGIVNLRAASGCDSRTSYLD
ncbi:hypothetical protein CPB86DRAFT_18038 [Serendipita vermifera]|nr:hypothetical protein CPB86DRAFT_18038 [Serendipita vermifera]